MSSVPPPKLNIHPIHIFINVSDTTIKNKRSIPLSTHLFIFNITNIHVPRSQDCLHIPCLAGIKNKNKNKRKQKGITDEPSFFSLKKSCAGVSPKLAGLKSREEPLQGLLHHTTNSLIRFRKTRRFSQREREGEMGRVLK